jgi:hypothetical protein
VRNAVEKATSAMLAAGGLLPQTQVVPLKKRR